MAMITCRSSEEDSDIEGMEVIGEDGESLQEEEDEDHLDEEEEEEQVKEEAAEKKSGEPEKHDSPGEGRAENLSTGNTKRQNVK